MCHREFFGYSLLMTARRPVTATDIAPGAIVYRGGGKVAFRVVEVRFDNWEREDVASVVEVGTTRPASIKVSRLTVPTR